MTQQIINIGAAPNDGEGDNLRTAFDKVNENFSNVWAQGPVDSNVQIQGNTISTLQVNQDLALSPNGVGNVRLNNNTIPGANNTWFLGSTTNRWRGLFVGNVTAGNISTTNLNVPGDAYIGGNLTVVGDTIQIGNITTDTLTIQLANTAATDAAADGAGITVGANDDIATFLYDSGNNVWTTNIGLQVDGAITGTSIAVSDAIIYGNVDAINGNFTGNVTANYFFGNGSQLTGIQTGAIISNTAPSLGSGGIWWNSVDGRAYVKYGNIFIDLSPSLVPDPTTYVGNVVFDNLTIENVGNIIPAGNNAYSLGSAAFQWKDLWVSNNTIYINSVPITLGAGNVLTVAGNPVVTESANGTVDLANLAVDNNNIYNSTGQGVVISNFSFIDEAETAYVQIPAGNSASDLSVVQKQGNVRIAANTADWTFDTNGLLTLPGGDVAIGLQYGSEAILATNTSFGVATQGNATTFLNWSDDVANTSVLSAIYVNDPVGNTGDVAIRTGAIGNAHIWRFGFDGNLNLPSGGNIVGTTPNNNGYITWLGNSSGDGAGYTTLGLIPDDTLVNNDQYLIIDPTAPGHIHIRAGGEQDNSSADLILGGENSYFKVPAGANNEVRISANSHAWVFGADSILRVPNEGVIRSIQDTVILQSVDVLDKTYSARLGTTGGLYFETTDYPSGWLYLTNDSGNANINSPSGNINITSELSVAGNITANSFIGDGSQLTGLPASYSDANVATFLAAYGSNTISTTGNITAGNFIGAGSNVELVAQTEQWVFDTTGVLTVPGNITGADVVSANTFVSNAFNVVTAGNLSITSQYGLGFTGTILEDNGTLELIANGGGGVVLGWDSTYGNGLGNIATVNFNEVGGEGILLRTGNRAATEYNWNFDSAGNLTLPSAGYLLVQTGIIGAGASPAPTLSGFSSIATTGVQGNISASGNLLAAGYANITGNVNGSGATFSGNVTAQNFVGNISITGNVTGTTPNVTLIAGSYSWTFDNTGIASLPAVGGDEGGEINFGIPTANTTLTGPVKVDVYRDQLRFFDGSIKGAYLDLANCPGGVSTAIGYRDIPQISFTGNTTTVANAAGRHYYSTQSTDYVLTIANNTSVGWSVGTAITIVNRGTGNMTIAQGTGVSLYLAGNSTAGNRTVTTYGMATLLNVAANVWMINGTGVS